ncbi:hypothetical protein BH20ACT2_BH20ACT2_23610 [soil metagenome]
MAEYVRMFQSAVDPADVEEMRRLFNDDVRTLLGSRTGCLAIELLLNTEHNAGGLVEGCAISRWSSLDDLRAGLDDHAVRDALVRVRSLLRHEPITKTYEVLE